MSAPSREALSSAFHTQARSDWAVYLHLAALPEHPLVDEIIPSAGWPEGTHEVWKGADAAAADSPAAAVAAYRRSTSRKSDVERQMDDRTKTGVFTGAFAANPLNGNPIPVFVADYVLMGYGTGKVSSSTAPAIDPSTEAGARRMRVGLSSRASWR